MDALIVKSANSPDFISPSWTSLKISVRSIWDLSDITLGGFVPSFSVRWSTIAIGLGIAILLGLISGAVPAVLARRLRITEALRHVG